MKVKILYDYEANRGSSISIDNNRLSSVEMVKFVVTGINPIPKINITAWFNDPKDQYLLKVLKCQKD